MLVRGVVAVGDAAGLQLAASVGVGEPHARVPAGLLLVFDRVRGARTFLPGEEGDVVADRVDLVVVGEEGRGAPAFPRAGLEVDAALLVAVVEVRGDEHLLPVGGQRGVGGEVVDFLDVLQEGVRNLAHHDFLQRVHEEVPAADVPFRRFARLLGAEVPQLVGLDVEERDLRGDVQVHDGIGLEVDQCRRVQAVFLLRLAVRFELRVTCPEEDEAPVVGHGLLREVASLLVEGEDAGLQQPALHAGRRIDVADEQARRFGRFQTVVLSRAARRDGQDGGHRRPKYSAFHGGKYTISHFPRQYAVLPISHLNAGAIFNILYAFTENRQFGEAVERPRQT